MILAPHPQFRRRVRGYDRLEVDNYVTWAEEQLAATRQVAEQAFARYGACAAEARELSRRLAERRTDRSLSEFSRRIETMLQLAAEEAVEIRLSATVEAEKVIARAYADAAVVLDRARREAASLLVTSPVNGCAGAPTPGTTPSVPAPAAPSPQ